MVKMKKALGILAVLSLNCIAYADKPQKYYGPDLCESSAFECIKVRSGQSWKSLFPDKTQRDIVQRVNRTYNYLWAGKKLAVPKNLASANAMDFAPFPKKIKSDHEKQIIVDQDKLAWGAYDAQGNLLKWGPIASGSTRCSDNKGRSCLTLTGIFRMFSKENKNCSSDVYPVGRGGAKMPYCMYFHKGFAMHGSHDIPGRRASHGCVRMFTRDAKWLNQEFVSISNESNGHLGTKVIVRPVTLK